MSDQLTPGQRTTVSGVLPDSQPRWSFTAETVSDNGDGLVLAVREGEVVAGPEPWRWQADGLLYLWRTRHYSILVTTRARRFPYWYCAIHTPAQLQDGEIAVTDLDLDLQLFADGRYSVGGAGPDAARYPALAALGQAAVAELIAMIKQHAPPFDGRALVATSPAR